MLYKFYIFKSISSLLSVWMLKTTIFNFMNNEFYSFSLTSILLNNYSNNLGLVIYIY